MQLSGHKNVSSVNNYAVASESQQKSVCNILSGKSRSVSEFVLFPRKPHSEEFDCPHGPVLLENVSLSQSSVTNSR